MLVVASVLALAALVLRATTPAPPEPPERMGRLLRSELTWEGRTRTWLTYRPERAREPAPLVLDFVLGAIGSSSGSARTIAVR